MTTLQKIRFRRRLNGRRGATALEYALVLAFVAVAVLAGMNQLGYYLKSTLNQTGAKTYNNVMNGVQG